MDALNGYMTAYEILKYMAWIRGTPYAKLDGEVEKWLKQVDLLKYKNTKIKFYSGGTKRKLNTAIAMVIQTMSSKYLSEAEYRMCFSDFRSTSGVFGRAHNWCGSGQSTIHVELHPGLPEGRQEHCVDIAQVRGDRLEMIEKGELAAFFIPAWTSVNICVIVWRSCPAAN